MRRLNNVVKEGYVYETFGRAGELEQYEEQLLTGFASKTIANRFTGNLAKLTLRGTFDESFTYTNGGFYRHSKAVAVSGSPVKGLQCSADGKARAGFSCINYWMFVVDQSGNIVSTSYMYSTCTCEAQSSSVRNGKGELGYRLSDECGGGGGTIYPGEGGGRPPDGGGGNGPQPCPPYVIQSVKSGKVVMDIVSPCIPVRPPDLPVVEEAKINTDSLKAKFPCAAVLVVDSLSKLSSYKEFVEPFTTSQKPDLSWNSKELPWRQLDSSGRYKYQLGEESRDPNSFTGQTQNIYLNSKALQNSSQLLIATGAIHETLHAYISYNIATSETNVLNHNNDYGNWFAALDAFYTVKDLPANYSGHYQMLTDYFNKATGILAAWDNNHHTPKEYVMAMLFGLNTVDSGCPPDMKARLDKVFNDMKAAYNITEQNLTDFNNANLNAPANSKLPTSGC